MMNTLTINNIIADWQSYIEQEKDHRTKGKSIKNRANLSRISKEISWLKKELNQSFPEFGDMEEALANYNIYRQLDSLQKQIKTI